MKRFFFWLIAPWVRSLLGLLLLSLLIWFEGPLLIFNGNAPFAAEGVRWTCIAMLFLCWILCFFWSTVTIKFAGSKPVKAVVVDDPVAPDGDIRTKASDAEMSMLSKRMKEIKYALKKVRRIGGRSAQLPLYLMVGASGSGKTTVLAQSELKFSLPETQDGNTSPANRSDDGAHQCDWWLTDEAVLLDTPGHYTTHDRDREANRLAWRGVLKIVKKYRRRRPINGAIVTINVTDLLQKSDSALHVQALAIRERMKELHEQFGIRFPIYIVLTKCDLLAGFSEFFDHLGREERAQVWGVTFPLAKENQRGIAAVHGLSLFSAEFRHLEQQLQCRISDRLQQEHDVRRRALIYNFPQQFAAIGDVLNGFLNRAFEPSRYEVTAMLRGVYFTSAMQQGTPIDHVMDTLTAGFPVEQKMVPVNIANWRSYFISCLLREVIFQEAGLAGANLQLERRRRWLQWGAMAVIGLVLAAACAGLITSYLRNQSYVREMSPRVAALEVRAHAASADDDLAASLPLLNAARDLPGADAGRDDSAPLLMRLGLYQGQKLGTGAQHLYERFLKEILLPHIVSWMEAELRRGSADNSDYLFEALRVYLMLGDSSHFDAESVLAWIDVDWGRNLPGVNGAQRRELSDHVAALLRMSDEPHVSVQLDAGLIESTRLMLARMPLEQRIYRRLTHELMRTKLPGFDIGTAGGRDAYQVLARHSGQPLSQGIAGMYTRAGYQEFMAKADQAIADTGKDGWVLDQPKVIAGTDNAVQMKASLQQLYFDDYIKQWDSMFADVTIIPFASFDQAARVATILSEPDSPLRKLLQEASRQTTLDDLKLVNMVPDSVSKAVRGRFDVAKRKLESMLGAAAGDVVQVDAKSMNPVDAHFDELHKIVGKPDAAAPSRLDQILLKLKDVAGFLHAAGSAKAVGMPVPASDALINLKRESIGKPVPLAAILQSIDSSVVGLALGSERARLNALWIGSIAPFCRRAIAKRYPMVRSVTEEVTPDDFGNFFGPGGMMDDFFQKNLRPYVDMSGTPWRWRSVNNVSLGISQRTLNEFQRATIIRDNFFDTGEKLVSMRFNLKPLSVDTHFSGILLEINGQALSYEQNTAARLTSFQIPSAVGSNLVRLTVMSANASPEMKTEGPWAWFRMMDQGTLEASTQSERFKLTFDLGSKKLAFDLTANSVNNPFKREVLEQFNCLDSV